MNSKTSLNPKLEGIVYGGLGEGGRFSVAPKVSFAYKTLIYRIENDKGQVQYHSVRMSTDQQLVEAFNSMTIADITNALNAVLEKYPNL